jgi:hypothetical protein
MPGPLILIPLLYMKREYYKENFHKIVIPLAIAHIATNIFFFAINLGLKDTDEDKAKIKTHNIIHAAISWTAIVSYFIFGGILGKFGKFGKELFTGKYMIPNILMFVHAIVNLAPVLADPSLIKIIYPIISTLVCVFITFRSWVSDKTWDGMFSNVKKMKDKITKTKTTEGTPAETDTTATDATTTAEGTKTDATTTTEGTKTDAATTTEGTKTEAATAAEDFGKRQRRRNPPKRRRRRKKKY